MTNNVKNTFSFLNSLKLKIILQAVKKTRNKITDLGYVYITFKLNTSSLVSTFNKGSLVSSLCTIEQPPHLIRAYSNERVVEQQTTSDKGGSSSDATSNSCAPLSLYEWHQVSAKSLKVAEPYPQRFPQSPAWGGPDVHGHGVLRGLR